MRSRCRFDRALIDGEAVVVDVGGMKNFQALQSAIKGEPQRMEYYAFDLLSLNGEDLTGLPLLERKERLAGVLKGHAGRIHYSDHIVGQGEALFDNFCGAGLEGIISKRADAPYVGSRGGTWLKTKCVKRQEFVIVGWTSSDKGRGFRSLLLGVNEGGKLRYAGKVGTGFDTEEILALGERMEPLAVAKPTVDAPRASVRGAHWIRPALVAEIAFTEMTNDGTLRHPSYLGLREDKKPEAVVLETEAPVADAGEPEPVQGQDQQPGPGDRSRWRRHQGAAGRSLRCRRLDHAAVDRKPADEPCSLPTGPRQEMLLPEARRRHVRRRRPSCRDS